MWGRVVIRKIGADDWVMVVALGLFLILAAFVTYCKSMCVPIRVVKREGGRRDACNPAGNGMSISTSTSRSVLTSQPHPDASIGGCKHLAALTPIQVGQAVKFNWMTQVWGIMGFAVAKISVALLILRIIGPFTVYRKYILYFTMLSVFCINAIVCILIYAQCTPPRALWEPQLIAAGEARCWNPNIVTDYAIFLSSWNVAVDVLLACLPVTIVYQLKNTGLRKKIGICVLLGLGLVAAICGAIKIKFLAGLNARSDLTCKSFLHFLLTCVHVAEDCVLTDGQTGDTYNLFAWSGAELFVIIVCGSIPPIKPLFDKVFERRKGNGESKRGSYNSSRSLFGSGGSGKTRVEEATTETTVMGGADEENAVQGTPEHYRSTSLPALP